MTLGDTLRSYRTELERQVRPDNVPPASVGVAAVSLLLWAVLLGGWLPTPSMPGPMAVPGVPEAMGTGNGLVGVAAYLLVWGVMMSAMMYPAMLPTARRYVDALDEADARSTGTFVATLFLGYSLVWTATGVVPLLVDALVGIRGLVAGHGTLVLAGLGLLIAGYQQSDYKRDALAGCCRDVVVSDRSFTGALERGFDHGKQCVRATWPFFALMVAAGSMNPVVMLGLTVVVAAERLPAWGEEVSTAIGIVSAAASTVLVLTVLLP
ncbi:DUF2182 domain-containing protein [Halorientalis pallida]|uniref:DUF2182 domain-containing protein n=1 Tax=Halorientalis pallida TaxID=2479928 RepID=UPI003C7014FE